MDKQLVSVTSLADIAAIADQVAGAHALIDYQARKSEETRRRQRFDLEVFARFLASAAGYAGDLYSNLEAWRGVSYGLVAAFVRWMERESYAIGSINVRLATVRAYAALAVQAGYLSGDELAKIKTVKGYRAKEGRNLDEKRDRARRENAKKAAPVEFSPAHATLLKQHAMAGKHKNAARDFLILCLLLDHGLRCEEVASLNIGALNLVAGTLTFYRHKVDLEQTHNLTGHSLQAAQAYLATLPATRREEFAAPLFAGIAHRREVTRDKSARRKFDRRIAERTIEHIVARYGARAGLPGLSPHDCRHYWATWAIKAGTDVKSLQDAGGWASPAMPLKYAARACIANEGVKLPATVLSL
jgi:integrase